MARRYSGDAEIRVGWDPRRREYYGSIRDPYHRPLHRTLKGRGERDPTSPESYDAAAIRMLDDAHRESGGRLKVERRRGRVVVRRVFQSPCPLEDV